MNPTPRPRRRIVWPLCLVFTLGLTSGLLNSHCRPVLADDQLWSLRQQQDARFQQQLEQLADKCLELGLAPQAELTRDWFVRRDPQRQYVFLPPAVDPTRPKSDAPKLVRYWHDKFMEYRKQRAAELFQLARQAVDWQPSVSYQWLHEVLREDPDHEAARRTLGYRLVNGRWRRPTSAIRSSSGTIRHPRLGFPPRSYWTVETENFRIVTNHSSKAGVELARQLEQLVAVWRQLFFGYWSNGTALKRWFEQPPAIRRSRRKHQVVLFRQRDEYFTALRSAEPRIEMTLGIYLEDHRTAYFYAGDGATAATWLHETTHQLFSEAAGVVVRPGLRANFWIVEGVALYMESMQRHPGYFTVGGFDADRLQFARYRALSERFYRPLEELTGLGRNDIQQDQDIRRIYSQSAGLAGFLMDYQQGRYRPALQEYLRAVYRDQHDSSTLAQLAAPTGYAELDAQYHRFLRAVTDADMEHVHPVRNLCLAHTQVTDKGLAWLAGGKNLEWLDLGYTQVTDAAVAHFRQARQLQNLNLEQTRITDRALTSIAQFRNLEQLDLSGTAVSDEGLAQLPSLKKLKVLWLTATRVSDAGLQHLKQLKQLETLDVSGTSVTQRGWDELKKALPALAE